MTDLPLFQWKPETCQVIPFPGSSRLGKARKLASLLVSARSAREANHRFNQQINSMCNQMERVGIPADEVERQLNSFLRILHAECQRMDSRWRPTLPDDDGPGDAA